MIFITQADIDFAVDSQTLSTITDANSSNLDKGELIAIAEMTGYIDVRYDAEEVFAQTGTDRDPIIIQMAVYIMIYHLHARISTHMIPEKIGNNYEVAINWLNGVKNGTLKPALPIRDAATEETTPSRFGGNDKLDHSY